MLRSSAAAIPDRPNRPLVVRCGYEGSSRRVTFPSAATCRLESLRNRVEECFSLSASPFSLSYTDDDGEEFLIRSETDLTEAISYFISGDDDAALSNYSGSGSGSGSMPYAFSMQKITIRLDVVVEYDGPSLSDTSSISSFQTGTGSLSASERDGASQGSWRSSGSGYEESYHTYASSSRIPRTIEEEYDGQSRLADPLGALTLDPPSSPESEAYSPPPQSQLSSQMSGSITPRRRSERMRTASASAHGSARSRHSPPEPPPLPPILTGRDSESAPSLLTHSELGSRWLREQSRLAARKLGPGPRNGAKATRYDSDEESFGSDDERSGDFALVRDARGRYYYSYQSTETSSLSSRSEADFAEIEAGPSRRPLSGFSSGSSTSTTSPPAPGTPLPTESPFEPVRIAEPSGPPILAPDCSACGTRLDYMRYVCCDCGEGEMWKENAPGKAAFVPHRVPSESDHSEASSSDATESGIVRTPSSGSGADSSGSRTVYNHRARSGSISTNASRYSVQALIGSASSPTNATYRYGAGPTPPLSPISMHGDLPPAPQAKLRGYELCAACIEVHGIAHSKAAAKAARNELSSSELRRRKKAGQLRHTFVEKIWGAEGWVDVEYNEDSECTICHSPLFINRFKCVSCSKFDLCRSCYQKVDEIHPAHVFMSLPDKPLPQAGPSRAYGLLDDERQLVAPQPMRHPGAFCHNCLSDLVGPRFHCAVCPSWDLCIQCEGVVPAGGDGSGHTASHILIKIPLPIPSSEVEAVSRRARDRWFQQDQTVAASSAALTGINGNGGPRGSVSSRSSSPTNDTVYAPTAAATRTPNLNNPNPAHRGSSPLPPSQIINVTQRDALDHATRCSNCNEYIMGRRYQCANCPSDASPYNLCSICELRSYRIHDPLHVFLKFDRPVHIPLRSTRPLLPLLYRNPVGKVPSTALATINPRDPTSYLKHVLHRETLCDVHGDQIRGVWLRCCHCAAGFDICQEAESVADHDPTHIFVVFKARVDMTAFRALADLSATISKPLIKQRVYLN